MRLGMKIAAIVSTDLDGFRVGLRFVDGTEGVVSFDHIFSSPRNLALEVLKGGMFEQCFVANGALAWPNGLEICPDAIHQRLERQAKRKTF